MRVAEDADIGLFPIQKGPPVFRQFPAFVDNMADGDPEAGEFDYCLAWKPAPSEPVNVAGDGRHRSDALQFFDHRSFADITGMENMIDTSEVSYDHLVEEAVGVGNDPDADRA